ncbi:nucleotidyltransferase family protein [Actinotalea sp. BY-33]|uniref:Nucleotidyltransferase family protein n=1 Tax=Actinotalea soli TaxID=2819234 RepID=A0A939RWA1_9CELL|nr:nucleotidyltransferase family protein [Actinotalea soli]MBO1751976.1 nucleotidyltransferase family protein [Actinotalea soli]
MTARPPKDPVVQTLVAAVGLHDLAAGAAPLLDAAVRSLPAEEVLEVVDAHRLAPAVARYLGALEEPPRELAAALGAQRTEQMVRHLATLAELGPLAAALDRAGVAWAVVKGPVVAADLWPSPDMRGYLDLDLLVDPHRLADVIDLLHGLGAEQIDLNWDLINRQERAELTFFLPRGTVLDLHWHLVNDATLRRRLRWSTHEVLARRRPVRVGSVTVPTLDRVDTLLHLAYHATHSGAYRLLWLKDVECAWAAVEDVEEVVRRAEAARVDMLVRVALDRASLVLGSDRCPALPWRSRRGALWRAALRLLDRWGSVPPRGVDGRTGRTRFTSVRTGTASSAWALIVEAAGHLRERRDTRRPEDDLPNPLHEADGDLRARRAYLEAVARQ